MTLTDSDHNQWLALEGFVEWQEETPPEQKKYDVPTRTLWYITKSYLLKKKEKAKTYRWAKKQSFMGRWMPESHEFYDVYLGEYPWAPAFLHLYVPYYNHEEWTNKAQRNTRIPTKILITDDEYMSSGSSLDCSTEESIRVKLPAKYIVDQMSLQQLYIDGRFFDESGDLVAFDPSLFYTDMPRCLFIRKDKLLNFLNKKGLSIVWTLLGEKNLIGGGGIGQPLGWLEINGAYTLTNSEVDGSLRATFLTSKS